MWVGLLWWVGMVPMATAKALGAARLAWLVPRHHLHRVLSVRRGG